MSSFASTLAQQIKNRDLFWDDFQSVSTLAIKQLLPPIQIINKRHDNIELSIQRLLQSATVFYQSSKETDQGLAQDIALFSTLASNDSDSRSLARDILCELGNHPGAERLRDEFQIPNTSLASHLRNALLRELNKVLIGENAYALTDFQRRVWSALPNATATAISAPTSAGKSFVVLEYLCQKTIENSNFTAAFIAPTRALLGEVQTKISERLKTYNENTRVSTIPTLDPEQKAKQIFVLTQERLQVLLSIWDGIFDLVIVDEAQAIGDHSRGMILQDCLEVLRHRSNRTRFLFLSPGATGFEAFASAAGMGAVSVEETDLSPVVQNRIIVEPTPDNDHLLNLALITGKRSIEIGSFFSEDRGFANANSRLAAVALELGCRGGSLVYGTGPANAENVAGQIASALKEQDSVALKELSSFVRKHVHPRYSLVNHVLKGVGFHYGKMPSLLREALEDAFRKSQLKYLVCTTTLFQGVNLPARNVFIDTPTRGRGDELDPASLWNFAGRAGRLGHDIVGNVFLVGYNSWENKPLTERSRFLITPSFRETVAEHPQEVLARLRDQDSDNTADDVKQLTESAAGLLISRAARGTLATFVERTLSEVSSKNERSELIAAAQNAFTTLQLPAETIAVNWTVNPFGQARLLKRFREKIQMGKADDLIPIHPSTKGRHTYSRYVGIFSRINRQIYGRSSSRKFSNTLASIALSWMNGLPLPAIIDNKIKYIEKANSGKKLNIDTAIRGVFDFVEDVLRFRYVQLGRAYVDLLRFALKEAGMEKEAQGIYDFPLALELGVSSVAGQSFIELGLSRISASTLEGLIPDSNPTVEKAREWIRGLTGTEFKLSKVILDELERKGLWKNPEITYDILL